MSAAVIDRALAELPSEIGEELEECGPAMTLGEAVVVLESFKTAIAELRALQKQVEQTVVELAGPRAEFEVAGVGLVSVRPRARYTKWDWERLVPAVVARLIDEDGVVWDRETGERVPVAESSMQIARRLNQCIGFSSGKQGGLKARGLDPDEFASVTFESEVRISK